jgi:hypothetical protein
MLVAIQLFISGLYLPPEGTSAKEIPPQTIISPPVQIAAWKTLFSGALVKLVAVHVSVLGLYLPPVLKMSV